MVTDYIQLLGWAVIGVVVTWGIFFAYVGFRTLPRHGARVASYFVLLIGVFWCLLWVSAVIYNFLELVGVNLW